ncbi:hypothetical protein FIBSPDRAFT_931086 [Athelia psychrophila]|uniref:Uncharacterized protein n=1 Tax=Athelia psychrophila TaxID=1759441 RepID=A0A166L0P5_9AGAM|nr:hypothetical protein FIBSPDRAFT_931086 [Fibularhizoctonia sp. CBS 109695]
MRFAPLPLPAIAVTPSVHERGLVQDIEGGLRRRLRAYFVFRDSALYPLPRVVLLLYASKLISVLLRGGPEAAREGVALSFQVASTTHVFLGLPYAELVWIVYVALFSALACRVFPTILPCKTVGDDEMGMGTVDMGGAVTTLASVQFVSRSWEDKEEGDGVMGSVRTVRRVEGGVRLPVLLLEPVNVTVRARVWMSIGNDTKFRFPHERVQMRRRAICIFVTLALLESGSQDLLAWPCLILGHSANSYATLIRSFFGVRRTAVYPKAGQSGETIQPHTVSDSRYPPALRSIFQPQ